jgi:hypothetical protein
MNMRQDLGDEPEIHGDVLLPAVSSAVGRDAIGGVSGTKLAFGAVAYDLLSDR